MLTPYEWHLDKDSGYYTFLTQQGLRYKIALFETSNSYFACYPDIKSFEISFFPDAGKSKYDERIGVTIVSLAEELLTKGYVVTFSCDISDNRHKVRDRLFESWFNKYAKPHFKKYDSQQLGDGEKTYYVSLLFDVRKHSRKTIENAFQKIINEYASYKNT